MKSYNSLLIIILVATLFACGDKKTDSNTVFGFDESKMKEQYLPSDALELQLKNLENKKIDSVNYFVNDSNIGTKKGFEKLIFEFKNQKLGYKHLKAIVFFEGKTETDTTRIELVTDVITKQLQYKIINTYPHDVSSFTEGLEFFRDTLYESTGSGDNCKSYFRKYDYKTGKVYKQIDLEQPYFGEGITILNGKLFQLTYQDSVGFIYDINSLKREKSFKYDKKIEGWGMTNDGKYIYHTDKSEKIWKMDPNTQKMMDYINVYTGAQKVKEINELEWINGKIYSNIWTKDSIAIINPKTGAVESVIDLSNLRKLANAKPECSLNGIAYNPVTKTIFVTGKNWEKMFEIVVVN